MDIESKLQREGGSRIQLGDAEYHFAPGADGAHVAQVDDDEHVAILLAIPEGFRIHRPIGWPTAPAASIEPSQTEQATASDGDTADGDLAAIRAELAAQYEAKFSKKPHYNLSIDKLRAAIATTELEG